MAVGIAKRRRTKQQLQHSDTSSQLQEATAQVTGLARDQLVEQYRSYSRDLAHQAERLGEQLTKYQQENAARLVTRERVWYSTSTASRPSSRGWLLRFSRAENAFERGGRGVLIQTLAPDDIFCL